MKIMIVEDDALLALDLRGMCEDLGHQVLGLARSADEADRAASRLRPDVLLTDMELADSSDGVEVVHALRTRFPNLLVAFVTAVSDPAALARIDAVRPDAILNKPVTGERLECALHRASRSP
ncbi:response regulator [Tranquillimonas alkanivorans]|uniref:Response regulator receiver domain-containing protein n=1 Tax=Tranquillimonas alkanivorans TaxID=441119 RepID=A0A1I5WAB4_9RHOB|nr:response regulator [Tranquillimonas alkanivorans]SFQ16621.1 Response regulator receiver domain-containing protein [Tranquillimonas alkanivorans]